MPTVSFCIIVKDEARNLEQLLPLIKDYVHEMIVVDTGSSDDSKKIAIKHNARVFDFQWVDDFSKAKNFALENASSEWVLFLDADERISKKYLKGLQRLLQMDFDAFTFIIREYCNNEFTDGFLANPGFGYKGYYTYKSAVRLFRNNLGYSFENPVHELVDGSIAEKGGRVADLDLPIIHLEMDKGEDFVKLKQEKYLNYMEKFVQKNSENVKILCDIGLSYYKYKKDFETAIIFLNKAHEIDPNYDRFYILCGELFVLQQNYDEAIKCYKDLIRLGKKLGTAYFNLGQIYRGTGRLNEAKEAYEKALENKSQHADLIVGFLKEL